MELGDIMKKENIVKILLILVVIVFGLLLFIFMKNKDNDMKKFNLDGEYVDYVDEYLIDLEKSLNEKNINFSSEKSKNSRIDSILITIKNDEDDISYNNYLSYNIDHNKKTILNNEEVANYFNYTLDDIIDEVNKRLKRLYDEESKQGYVDTRECDIDCYKSYYRGIDDIYSSYSLYVKNDKLYIYLSFKVDSLSGDDEFFKKLKYNPYKIEM